VVGHKHGGEGGWKGKAFFTFKKEKKRARTSTFAYPSWKTYFRPTAKERGELKRGGKKIISKWAPLRKKETAL